MALQKATNAAMSSEIKSAGPAIPAAGAITAKMPAPKMAASPVATASKKLSWGLRVGSGGFFSAKILDREIMEPEKKIYRVDFFP